MRLFWMIAILWAYIGLIASGKDGFIAQKTQAAFDACVAFFEDVEVDYQIPEELRNEWEKIKNSTTEE